MALKIFEENEKLIVGIENVILDVIKFTLNKLKSFNIGSVTTQYYETIWPLTKIANILFFFHIISKLKH